MVYTDATRKAMRIGIGIGIPPVLLTPNVSVKYAEKKGDQHGSEIFRGVQKKSSGAIFSPLAMSELMYMKQEFGEDFTGMEFDEVAQILERSKEPVTIREKVMAANQGVLNHAIEEEEWQLAVDVLYDIWRTTMDEDAKALLDKITGEVDE